MLAVSVFFEFDLAGAVVVGMFALAGVVSAFLIQMLWLKGKAMPALPPIAFLSLIGFLIATQFLN
jgi:presenilin-like A22 family membrane protease